MSNADKAVDLAVMDEEIRRKCRAEIDAVLQSHGCMLDASMILRNGAPPQLIVRVLRNPQLIVPGGTILPPTA